MKISAMPEHVHAQMNARQTKLRLCDCTVRCKKQNTLQETYCLHACHIWCSVSSYLIKRAAEARILWQQTNAHKPCLPVTMSVLNSLAPLDDRQA